MLSLMTSQRDNKVNLLYSCLKDYQRLKIGTAVQNFQNQFSAQGTFNWTSDMKNGMQMDKKKLF